MTAGPVISRACFEIGQRRVAIIILEVVENEIFN
jgi:hypothetical protein